MHSKTVAASRRFPHPLPLEVTDEIRDALCDVVPDQPHVGERPPLGVGQVPADVALSGDDRTRVVTGRDDDISPLDQLWSEASGRVVRSIYSNLFQRVENCGMRALPRLASS